MHNLKKLPHSQTQLLFNNSGAIDILLGDNRNAMHNNDELLLRYINIGVFESDTALIRSTTKGVSFHIRVDSGLMRTESSLVCMVSYQHKRVHVLQKKDTPSHL